MILGSVTDDGVPVITLDAGGRQWRATIDTGFNGGVELPLRLRPFVNPEFVGHVRSSLAAGQTVVEEAHYVDFPFDGRTVRSVATFVPGEEILLGTGLLRDYRLEINFVEQTVLLEWVGGEEGVA
ncbi:MAG: hypothetical protein COZ06_01120 [Armatimonadetes bacterium CG_4_10_14_3_um_filter_66_18]|nr:hypothetical protein [Armatimonadota bacterium]OIO91715.1 MAG: hypothetical protein AUJ96_33415 [Armatimonadetes bacterium CG2_30_66_41]PIU92127.1 MAG: hypothetical protein COS65_19535 [Armatimonadetes bacterium CG06_land_8_20_14_3_00_66_21]PIX37253.1 MAG: hypothetical protein COZ57_35300 [Armatimonadetes bacterium CG_4_8_14_3_um_filter_66_20]PIY53814.1 MAG: hypothetical protein COZ06_01120 [Armatimonadetes bacterium CG_4_10_14_3_um_filter_66_18]PIZ32915.1 MAG: hypothetical protein COY42_30